MARRLRLLVLAVALLAVLLQQGAWAQEGEVGASKKSKKSKKGKQRKQDKPDEFDIPKVVTKKSDLNRDKKVSEKSKKDEQRKRDKSVEIDEPKEIMKKADRNQDEKVSKDDVLSAAPEVSTPLLSRFRITCLVLLASALVAYRTFGSGKAVVQPRAATGGTSQQEGKPSRGRAASANGGQFHSDPVFNKLLSIGKEGRDPPEYTHMQAALLNGSDREFVIGNPPAPFTFENEFCVGEWLPMFRPTAQKQFDHPDTFAYHNHFKGRKRVWEHRFQFKFKVPIGGGDECLRMGIGLNQYVPLNAFSKKSMKVVVAALKKVVGQNIHHAVGEPSSDHEEVELPGFSMPLWATDQFIVTPEGEDPPSLSDPDFATYGLLRASDRHVYVEELSQLELKPGPTFTFGFWGISQFLDAVKWSITGVGPMTIDFNSFCGSPPVTCQFYTLKPNSISEDDPRHLESRKNYFFRIDFWSSKQLPTMQQVDKMFPQAVENQDSLSKQKENMRWYDRVMCCSSVRGHLES